MNNQLKKNYKSVFKLIDKKIYLKVPNFNNVFKWRLLQEKKLQVNSAGKKVMNKDQIKKFVMFYERLTKQMFNSMVKVNAVIKIDTFINSEASSERFSFEILLNRFFN